MSWPRLPQSFLMLFVASALAGCASMPQAGQHPWGVPSDAQIVAHGAPTISFLISHPGVIYIFDDSSNALVSTMDLTGIDIKDAHPSLLVIDKAKAAIVARQPGDHHDTVLMEPIDTSDQFSIWFKEGASRSSVPATQTTTVPARPQR